jgi:hypothetical protein
MRGPWMSIAAADDPFIDGALQETGGVGRTKLPVVLRHEISRPPFIEGIP